MRDAPVRVAHVVPALFGPDGVVGGAERYAYELARAMAERVPTTLVSFSSEPASREDGRLSVRVLGPAWHVRGQRQNPMHLGLFAALRDATVVHCHQQHVVASTVTAAWCRLTGRTVVVSDLGGGGWDLSGYVPTDRWYHAHLHISRFSRTAFGHDRFRRAHVVYGGVDVGRFRPAVGGATGSYALYVGRLLPHKGVDALIEALPDHMPLVIVGREFDARYRTDLERLAVGRDVTFRRDADDEALVRLYQHARCVVLPSVHRSMYGTETPIPELLGQTLLEGMACGRPVICTRVGPMPEVVEDGCTGFVVPPHRPDALRSALSTLRAEPDVADRMGRSAREHVERHFTWPRVVDRCLKIYRESARRVAIARL